MPSRTNNISTTRKDCGRSTTELNAVAGRWKLVRHKVYRRATREGRLTDLLQARASAEENALRHRWLNAASHREPATLLGCLLLFRRGQCSGIVQERHLACLLKGNSRPHLSLSVRHSPPCREPNRAETLHQDPSVLWLPLLNARCMSPSEDD